jgi:uncharacterized protein CbrC (UPF0167 family)
MADLKITATEVTTLKNGFMGIKGTLDLTDRGDMQANQGNVGHDSVCRAVEEFNNQVADTRYKYKVKTENFIDFLENVSSGSEDVDNELSKALSVG